jgi:vacuolar-type H+-ATPase subunit E/Vma4
MEELQSTEILDREILEDARKKAYKILKTADETVKAGAEEWEKKNRSALGELDKRYAERLERASLEIMARLPLDKRRAKSELIEGLLKNAVDSWFNALSHDRILGIIEKELALRLAACPDSDTAAPRVTLHNMGRDEAEALLRKTLVKDGRKLPSSLQITEMPSISKYPAMIIDTQAVRITVSIDMVLDTLLHERREELVGALIGEAVND